jgi:translation elongation factor EF-Tu-like GTPase
MEIFAFADYMEPAGDKPIKVLARISVLKTEDGGKLNAFTKNYRPNHNFGTSENRGFFIGQIEVSEGVWIHPGETHNLEITFLNVVGLLEKLQIGKLWRIQEGGKLVAHAQLLSIISM